MTNRIPLLMLSPLQDQYVQQVAQAYDLVYAPSPEQKAAALREHGRRLRAVLTIGAVGLSAAEMDAMPQLELVCALGRRATRASTSRRRRRAAWS